MRLKNRGAVNALESAARLSAVVISEPVPPMFTFRLPRVGRGLYHEGISDLQRCCAGLNRVIGAR